METMTFSPADIREMAVHFNALSTKVPVRAITTESEYAAAVRALNALLDAGASDETHELAPLVDALGDYEEQHHRLPEGTPQAVLRELMTQHGVTQSALPEIGSQGVVPEILGGKRALNVRQIASLAQRFGVSPAAFLTHHVIP